MYQALVDRDSRFEGIFYVGVKTTGIFCRSTCRARKPLLSNVEFFPNTKEALDHGYRACKVCKPMYNLSSTAPEINDLLEELHKNPTKNLKDFDLRDRALDPVKIRRWFQKNHGMTFHAYQRSLRLNHAFGRLQKGEKITDTAYDLGYESLSGFTDAFRKKMGFPPGSSGEKEMITMSRIETPLGPMMAGATEKGICLLEFTDRRMLETQIKTLKRHFKNSFIPGLNSHLTELGRQLDQYFHGERHCFELSLLYPGTPFQRKVWDQLCEIPAGSTRTYSEQAQACGDRKAVRAVAKANGDNRIAILIPCHRVIGSNGSMTGYGGGIWRKKWLLDHEVKMMETLRKG
ncbi:MAG: methylated-DNA--[protein]-cysteine S-methyltransferase [Saprospiraceae bacterium]|nr:methylated-DNA--[protein]-cysteine S-methyltransferase [Saprospiraceae bacterium]